MKPPTPFDASGELASQIAKLPSWAQGHIANLERALVDAKAALPPPGTDTGIAWRRGLDEWLPIPHGVTVRFMCGEFEVDCEVREGPPRLAVHTIHGRLVVMPVASNWVDMAGRWP